MPEFTSAAEAFRIARERASTATALEVGALHMAVYAAREEGRSIRQTADALRVPKSTVARHWNPALCSARHPMPVWGSESAWREAHDAIWAHDPAELADDFVPYEWAEDNEGQRIVRARARGRAVIDEEGTARIVEDDSAGQA